MRLELRVVELLHGVLHVFVAHVLDDAGAVLEDVREAHVPSLAHVILEVLPAARRQQTCEKNSIVTTLAIHLTGSLNCWGLKGADL